MNGNIQIREYPAPPFDEKEALRYAGCRGEWLSGLPGECYAEMAPQLEYRVCWGRFALRSEAGGLILLFEAEASAALKKALRGCADVIAFAATVGFAPDRLVRRYERVSPAKALLMQAVGAERIEALCGAFEQDMREEYRPAGLTVLPRFSPGYGDLPLAVQKPLLEALQAQKYCGITLTDSLLMLPTKSVTAIMGLRPDGEDEP